MEYGSSRRINDMLKTELWAEQIAASMREQGRETAVKYDCNLSPLWRVWLCADVDAFGPVVTTRSTVSI